jgi:hypothetical protein
MEARLRFYWLIRCTYRIGAAGIHHHPISIMNGSIMNGYFVALDVPVHHGALAHVRKYFIVLVRAHAYRGARLQRGMVYSA